MAGDPETINGYFGPILTNRLCGNTKPNSIMSQGNMVWVQFVSDRNSTTVYKGLKASFKAGVSWRWVLLNLFKNAARKFFYIFSFGELELIQLLVVFYDLTWSRQDNVWVFLFVCFLISSSFFSYRKQTFFLSCQLTIKRNDLYVVFTSIFQSFSFFQYREADCL